MPERSVVDRRAHDVEWSVRRRRRSSPAPRVRVALDVRLRARAMPSASAGTSSVIDATRRPCMAPSPSVTGRDERRVDAGADVRADRRAVLCLRRRSWR